MIEREEQARAFCADICGSEGILRIEKFIALLALENERQNLVSTASLKNVWVRHIADSLQLLLYVPRETSPWLDMGSGAGFPGLAIAIARPDTTMHLVESRKRRVEWLDHIKTVFSLDNCVIKGSRLETVESAPFAAITARAFAPLGKLLTLSARFSTHSTTWLLPKGRSAVQELEDQPTRIRSMFHVEQSLTDRHAAILIGQGRPQVP